MTRQAGSQSPSSTKRFIGYSASRPRPPTLFQTLAEINSQKISRKPTGFIFHMSRCGSTLIAQMLAALQEVLVFSEPALLETLLRKGFLPVETAAEQKQWLLENLIQAFLNYQTGWQSALIKFSARATLDYPLINQLYPATPGVFVYREPVEVLVALIGPQTEKLPPNLDKAGLLNNDSQTIRRMRPAEFWARVVAKQCAAAVEMCAASQPLLINYSQLPEIVWTDLANFFGIPLSSEDIERMRAVSTRNAKEPHQPFTEDSANNVRLPQEKFMNVRTAGSNLTINASKRFV